MRTIGIWILVAVSMLLAACGSDAAPSRCPAAFPVERDGFCYAADGDASVPLDAGPTTDLGTAGGDSGTLPDANGVDSGMGPLDGSAVICVGEHPIVEGTRRFCNAGDCYCGTPESCFPADTADACCDVAVVCTAPDTDAGTAVICVGEHPNTTGMGTLRWCDPGNCFCADPDSCFPTDTADACCPGAVVCY